MELELLAQLKAIASHPAARGLADDAALFEGLVYTHDMLVEGVHFLSTDPPADVGWKLVSVNLSDLAAKGAKPVAALMGAGLSADTAWNAAFVEGVGQACKAFEVALIGGDTVSMPKDAPKVLGLTAIGRAGEKTPSRSDAQLGDIVFVSGTIGSAGAGLAMAKDEEYAIPQLLNAYLRPQPLVAQGLKIAKHVHAMMDVSDGLLIDAARIAEASGVGISIDLDAVPIEAEALAYWGEGVEAVIAASIAGDDYALLGTAADMALLRNVDVTEIGHVTSGQGLSLFWHGKPVPLPQRLGWLHG